MESRKGRRKIPAWFWENICNLWLVIVYFTEIMIQQFFPAPRRGLNLGLQFFPGLKPRAEFYRPCGTVLFADMIFYTYCLFMEIWQNHFLKKQFSSDQIWRKYLFFEKLWDICDIFSQIACKIVWKWKKQISWYGMDHTSSPGVVLYLKILFYATFLS